MRPKRMTITIDDAGRARLTDLCASFTRLPQPAEAKGLKHAAVALVVVDGVSKNDPCLLITRRSPNLRSHAAQWALPGGRCDAGETPVDTALRELDEELGLRISPEDVLVTLDDYPTRSGYVVTPVVIWGGRIKSFNPNPDEVQSVHRAPMTQLADYTRLEFLTIPESDRPVIRMRLWDSTVHAPTAAFLYQFCELVAGRITRVAHLEQPVFAWR